MSLSTIFKFLFIATASCLFHNVDSKDTRIIGGYIARPGEFKYQVSLQSNHVHMCGGALISAQHVLTAAHCVVDEPNVLYDPRVRGPLTVKAGMKRLNDRNFFYSEVQEFAVSNLYRKSQATFYVFDFAILKLRNSFDLRSPNIQVINLPDFTPNAKEVYAGHTAVVAGWGTVYNGATQRYEIPIDLFAQNLQIWDTNSCNQVYRGSNIRVDVENQICAYAPRNDGKLYGTCQGDSGSPLVFQGAVIGVASSAPIPCGRENSPAVFARISAYVPFIRRAMAGNYDSTHVVKRF